MLGNNMSGNKVPQPHRRSGGFTIVELLIVIVVIGILAAITIVSFNGVTKKATAAAVQSELSQNAKSIMATAAVNGQYSNVDVMNPAVVTLKFDASKYKVISYCSTSTDFAFAAQTTSGDKYYKKMSGAVVQDNSIDAFLPCTVAGISGGQTTYLNLPTSCGGENTTCTFSGTATIVYGSVAQGSFNKVANVTSTYGCNNSNFGDPASGYSKACYVYPN